MATWAKPARSTVQDPNRGAALVGAAEIFAVGVPTSTITASRHWCLSWPCGPTRPWDGVGCVNSVPPANRHVASDRPEFWHPTRVRRLSPDRPFGPLHRAGDGGRMLRAHRQPAARVRGRAFRLRPSFERDSCRCAQPSRRAAKRERRLRRRHPLRSCRLVPERRGARSVFLVSHIVPLQVQRSIVAAGSAASP